MVYLLKFKPATWFGMSVPQLAWLMERIREGEGDAPICAAEELWPVFDGHYGVPSMDEVEMVLWMEPGRLDVVDHELHIGWYPCWLDWREVDTENGC